MAKVIIVFDNGEKITVETDDQTALSLADYLKDTESQDEETIEETIKRKVGRA